MKRILTFLLFLSTLVGGYWYYNKMVAEHVVVEEAVSQKLLEAEGEMRKNGEAIKRDIESLQEELAEATKRYKEDKRAAETLARERVAKLRERPEIGTSTVKVREQFDPDEYNDKLSKITSIAQKRTVISDDLKRLKSKEIELTQKMRAIEQKLANVREMYNRKIRTSNAEYLELRSRYKRDVAGNYKPAELKIMERAQETSRRQVDAVKAQMDASVGPIEKELKESQDLLNRFRDCAEEKAKWLGEEDTRLFNELDVSRGISDLPAVPKSMVDAKLPLNTIEESIFAADSPFLRKHEDYRADVLKYTSDIQNLRKELSGLGEMHGVNVDAARAEMADAIKRNKMERYSIMGGIVFLGLILGMSCLLSGHVEN